MLLSNSPPPGDTLIQWTRTSFPRNSAVSACNDGLWINVTSILPTITFPVSDCGVTAPAKKQNKKQHIYLLSLSLSFIVTAWWGEYKRCGRFSDYGLVPTVRVAETQAYSKGTRASSSNVQCWLQRGRKFLSELYNHLDDRLYVGEAVRLSRRKLPKDTVARRLNESGLHNTGVSHDPVHLQKSVLWISDICQLHEKAPRPRCRLHLHVVFSRSC